MVRKDIRTRPNGQRYPIGRSITERVMEGPRTTPVDNGDIGIVRVGGGRFAPLGYGSSKIHPYKIVSELTDGRRFEIRVNALNSQEAQEIAMKKFPLITIKKISRADKIKTVAGFLSTAERLLEDRA